MSAKHGNATGRFFLLLLVRIRNKQSKNVRSDTRLHNRDDPHQEAQRARDHQARHERGREDGAIALRRTRTATTKSGTQQGSKGAG